MTERSRGARHYAVSARLSACSDRQLGELLDHSRVLGSGVGGSSALLDVDGVAVFAKRVPLTDLERRSENVLSTANLFGLPAFCQYGVGSPGLGAWRELAANLTTTGWVLSGRCAAFPLLHHWRVLPGAAPLSEEHLDVDRAVAYWGGSPAVRERLRALAGASASVVLFLEFIPHTLSDWLAAQIVAGEEAAAAAMVETQLVAALAFMNDNGLLHLDAHFGNILTDGRRLFVADLGLATSPRFDLSASEADFVERNRTHDVAYAMMRLVNWLVPDTGGPLERNGYVRACAAGAEPVGIPDGTRSVIRRLSPVAAIMNDFYAELFGVSRAVPYPADEIERALRDHRWTPCPASAARARM